MTLYAVVRCYAFQALVERNTNDVFSIALYHLSDTTTIHTLFGCLGGSQKAGDFFLQTVLEKDENGKLYRMNDKQKAAIDSILLFDKGNKLETRDRLF